MRHPIVTVVSWVLVALVLTLAVAPLESVVQRGSGAFIPSSAPTVQSLRVMDKAFGSGQAQSFGFVVLEDNSGLDDADQSVYRSLVTRLGANKQQVAEIEDYISDPALKSTLTSHDKKAVYIPLGLSGAVGSPKSIGQLKWVRGQTDAVSIPAGTHVYVTGDPAMIADLSDAVTHVSDQITIVSAILLVVILAIIYRRFVTILIPLATIVVGILCARGLLALLGEHGLPLSTYTTAFVMAIVLGAGTDYTVFLISRFREHYSQHHDHRLAVAEAGDRIGGALLASAATVILGCACLAFTKLAIFSTTGPPMAVAISVTLLVSLTLTPVLMTWAGARIGEARPVSRRNVWGRAGLVVAARPGRVLTAGLLVLVALVLAVPGMKLSFDERAAQPASTPSNRGYQALNAHFPKNTTLPDYLLVDSPHDLRNPSDLAALNTLSTAISKVPGVSAVYSITQPNGTSIPQARISAQLTTLATSLKKASAGLSSNQPQLDKLKSAGSQISSGTQQAASGSEQLANAIPNFVSGLATLSDGLGSAATNTTAAESGAQKLVNAAGQLASGLQQAHDQAATGASAISQIISALDKDVLCTVDPVCNKARAGLHQLYTAQQQQLLPGLQTAADGAKEIASGNQTLADGLSKLRNGLTQATSGASKLHSGATQLEGNVGQLSSGLQQLADATSKLPSGIDQLLSQTADLSTGLDKANTYLTTVGQNASTADAAGFYLPASELNSGALATARSAFLSPDGHIARIEIISTTDPLSASGLTTFNQVQTAAKQAIRSTPLATASISATGAAGLGSDLRHYLALDGRFVVLAVLLSVFLLLVITLRSLVAPLYLIVSVILSCGAALGLTTLVWQHLLGHAIEFNVPVIAFVLLVAVGADYNILLMTRMRENGRDLTRRVVSHSVTATGPVITAAGVIFASTFFALIFAPISGIAQTGFTVASGLILDTVVVRSLVVPACAAMLGSRSWWPSQGLRRSWRSWLSRRDELLEL